MKKVVSAVRWLGKKKKSPIQGYVERIDQQISGWVIHREHKPISLSLQIAGTVYPVSAVWYDRPDVATSFKDNAFLRSGFSIEIPAHLIDTFLQIRHNKHSVDVLANKVVLKNLIKESAFSVASLLPGELGDFDFQTVFALNAERGIEITAKEFLDLCQGHNISYPVKISIDDEVSANYYLEVARRNLMQRHAEYAKTLLRVCLSFQQRAEFFELLGNIYFDAHDHQTAACYYQKALITPGKTSNWLISNLVSCKKHLTDISDTIDLLLNGIQKYPDFTLFYDQLDSVVQEYWLKQMGLLEMLTVINDRQTLLNKTNEIAAVVYETYLQFYGATQNPDYVKSGDINRVLIVGDFHVSQCIRYRIEQKIEQLETAGVDVTAVSWTELAGKQRELVFHDVVIFYRVPAEPQVLKAMAQVNAAGKLSFYEIDDLLFEDVYPPPLETYGGYLNISTYQQLVKGMASFNAAARYCRFGIASTQPLADKLAALVFKQRCFLHRNGLDSLNVFKESLPEVPQHADINIFYGSGTMAHNSDFTELALPAIMRILNEFPKTHLIIAGYLKLPNAFLERYEERLTQIPPVKNIKSYWEILSQADINLAVLHDDEINGCKSELKWFEAACLEIPSIVSSTATYREVIRDGEDGVIAATTEDWYRHLKTLVSNAPLRQSMAKKARLRAETEYSIAALSINIHSVLAQAVKAAQAPVQRRRKKIALVNVYFPPQAIGGATRVISDNFDVLQKHYSDQFELCVFTSDVDHKHPYQMTVFNYQDTRVYRTTALWREYMDWHPKDEMMKELFSDFLKVEQPDLIHFLCVQRLTGSILEAAQDAKIPYLVTVHDAWWISDYQFLVDENNRVYPEGHPDPEEPLVPPKGISLSKSLERRRYLKELLHGAQEVLTVSEAFAKIYQKNGIPQICVNKNGLSDTIQWQDKQTAYTDKVVCGHVGGMSEHKGYFLLQNAIEALQPEHIELLIVDHSQAENYRYKSTWGKVPVTFIGRVSQSQVVNLYQQIDVLCAPSIWPESYGLVTREAAACGCWIVASNMGGIGEDVVEGQSGFVIEPTLENLMTCLKRIEQNPKQFKGKAYSSKLRQVSEQVTELSKIYTEVCK